jgi:hypothetical protein
MSVQSDNGPNLVRTFVNDTDVEAEFTAVAGVG